jgi:biopolymer transport protein ExbD
MSHGSDMAEMIFTPLLDLVLQLIMFFMICASFAAEELDATIKLPEALAGIPLDKKDQKIIFLNISDKGQLRATDRNYPLTGELEIAKYIAEKYDFNLKTYGKEKAREVLVVIRADAKAEFRNVYPVLRAVRKAGFERLQLRAIAKT